MDENAPETTHQTVPSATDITITVDEQNAKLGGIYRNISIEKVFMDEDFSIGDLTRRPLQHIYQINVRFITEDSNIISQQLSSTETIGNIKNSFVPLFNIPAECLDILTYKDKVLDDDKILGSLRRDKFGTLRLKLKSTSMRYSVISDRLGGSFVVPDILTVKVDIDGEIKEVVVEMENRAIKKPKLGGYRNTETGMEYYHGYSQTGPPPPKVPPWMKSHRDTQTYDLRNRKIQQSYPRATQMARNDLYIPSITDKIMVAGPYETADEREKRLDVEGKIKTIQRYFRAWKMKEALKELSEEYHKRLRLEREREERERKEDEDRKKQDLVSKVFPLTSTDFAMLYAMIERWKTAELARIESTYCGASKIAELYLLLEKEIEILRNMDQLRQEVRKDLETREIVDFFKAIGEPIDWYSSYKNLHIFMDTLETQKGREYFAFYKSMSQNDLDYDERVMVYSEIIRYLSSHDCVESQQIITIICRITDLISRKLPMKYFATQEKMLLSMVLHHFKLDKCNEGVTSHMKKLLAKQMEDCLLCHSCGRLKPKENFVLNARTEKLTLCKACKWIDKAEEPWIDLRPYRFILKLIRNYERLHKAISSVAFIINDKDIHHIIIEIWHGHSALSECNDIYKLRLVRWKRHEEWAPWNCILLTLCEAKAHLRVEVLENVYEKEFINHIFNKHALARQHFAHLSEYDKHFYDATKDNPMFDEDSSFYNRPKPDCLFGDISSSRSLETSVEIRFETEFDLEHYKNCQN